jgi:hypothetical protein
VACSAGRSARRGRRCKRHGRPGAKPTARLPPTAGFGPRQSARRVVVKAHLQKLGSHGAQAAARHLRYIERGGVEKDGSPGVLYAPEGPAARETFEQPRLGERHQFRFIVSPEDARDLDLTDYVRELMKRVERDLGRSIEWAAANHRVTTPTTRMRTSLSAASAAAGNCAWIAPTSPGVFGGAPRSWRPSAGAAARVEIRRTREREVTQERFTSLDREIEHAWDRAPRRCRVARGAAPWSGAGAPGAPAQAA